MTHNYDIAIIGAGSGGLSVASGAAQLGLKTVLFEADRMGGDCLNVGCVPSKSIIAAGHAAHIARTSDKLGVTAEPTIDFARSMQHVHDVIASIAPHDSAERFQGLGAHVVQQRARFTGPATLDAGGETYTARRIVIATGSRPMIFPIPGLAETPYLTNETIWDLKERPDHLIILGGGNIGIELAQAFRRLGSRVSIVERDIIMAKDDPDLVSVVRTALDEEGIVIHENAEVERIDGGAGRVALTLKDGANVTGTHVLVATGRRRNTDDLGLELAGIETERGAIRVDARLRTSNKKVFAIGDCREGPQFTHAAGYDGGIVIRNIVFRIPAKASYDALPWVTFTDPELANVGMTERMARDRGMPGIQILQAAMADNDRAKAEDKPMGRIKIVLSKGKIVGCGIVGTSAGELIHPWSLAIAQGLKLSQMTGYIAPYPTLGEITKAGTNQYFTPKLFNDRVRWIVGLLKHLP
ncbi:FAD-dependent oxidoreductase [Pacificimonas sp. WHA3]|uniref:FAD-dependent oxidoreductase n=1 Tax=Pacificimonas pallii TaxID=2827236 RepID=A0ABS6SDU9_9SPHN|nr:FAD-dependent oxidoreductase [Pacificimonas pallii]MBV7256022.1 FAD-dependent oxidoreductase [Pacificimonas pallii]